MAADREAPMQGHPDLNIKQVRIHVCGSRPDHIDDFTAGNIDISAACIIADKCAGMQRRRKLDIVCGVIEINNQVAVPRHIAVCSETEDIGSMCGRHIIDACPAVQDIGSGACHPSNF
jgi:hypothetical protein